MSDQPPPGWYQDPSGLHKRRYWDGAAWTEEVDDVALGPAARAVEPLTADDEAKLARIIGRGREAADRLAYRNLKSRQMSALEDTVRVSRQAQQRLIASQRHLITPIAEQYAGLGVDLNSLIEEGNIALRRAAQAFDEIGVDFATYAAQKIDKAMITTLREHKSREQTRNATEPPSSPDEYVAEAETAERLTADDEIRVARVIEQGRRARKALDRRFGLMTQRAARLRQVTNWERGARRLIADRNQYLVARIASKYADRGMDLMALIEEGNHGLRRAVDTFDASHGQRFATHAEPFIREAVIKGLDRGNNQFTVS